MGGRQSKVRSKSKSRGEDKKGPIKPVTVEDGVQREEDKVDLALNRYFPGFTFHYYDGGIRLKDGKIMGFKINQDVFLYPIFEKNVITLIYGGSANYHLHVGQHNSSKENLRRFVYHWEDNGDKLTSPYHSNNAKNDSTVHCAKPIDITEAIKDSDSVTAVYNVLRDSPTKLNGDDFLWELHGPDNNFTVSTLTSTRPHLYWQGEDESNSKKGKITLTTKNANALRLILKDVDDDAS